MTQVNNHETSVGLLPGTGKAAYVSESAQSSAILPALSRSPICWLKPQLLELSASMQIGILTQKGKRFSDSEAYGKAWENARF